MSYTIACSSAPIGIFACLFFFCKLLKRSLSALVATPPLVSDLPKLLVATRSTDCFLCLSSHA